MGDGGWGEGERGGSQSGGSGRVSRAEDRGYANQREVAMPSRNLHKRPARPGWQRREIDVAEQVIRSKRGRQVGDEEIIGFKGAFGAAGVRHGELRLKVGGQCR